MATREYPRVLAWSANRLSLIAVHRQEITESEALDLICGYVDEGEVTVEFTGRVTGRFYYPSCRITLPPEGSGKLTIGITLHELAHALVYIDKGFPGKHGQEFVKQLDGLIKSEELWRKDHERTDENKRG